MDVDAPAWRSIEDGLWKQQAIGCHHRDIGTERCKSGQFFGRFQGARGVYRDAEGLCADMDGTFLEGFAASGGLWGAGIGRDDIMPGCVQGFESRKGEGRRAHEDDAHGQPARAFCRIWEGQPLPRMRERGDAVSCPATSRRGG
ncbi:hypothetical protein GCM10007973_14580 [Polymorphobacter multimanifer]|nr:hypothetical protein GCM10007973_14580 [Polymorphobacter multimanifer]